MKHAERSSRQRLLLTWGAVALVPIAIFYLLEIPRFSLQNGVDPFIYVGYQQDASDLIDRYGWYLYFPARISLVLPSHLLMSWFGIVPGYFLLRYVLALVAIIPLVWLGRQYGSRASGWAVAVICLASPIFIAATMTVYADTVGLPCMIAGTALLLGTGPRPKRRAAVAGLLFAAAFHANFFVVLPLVSAFGLRAVLQVVRGEWKRLVDYVIVAAMVVLATGVAIVACRIAYGTWDLMGPSIEAVRTYSGERALDFRQNNHFWLRITPHLYIPPIVGLALLGLLLTRRSVEGETRWRRWLRPGLVDAGVMLLGVLIGYAIHQFVLDAYSVETYYYYSYSFAFTCAALVMVFAELSDRGGRWVGVAAAATALLAPMVRNVAFKDFEIWVLPWVPIVAGVILVAAVSTRLVPRAAVVVAGMIAVVVGALAYASPRAIPPGPGMDFRVEPRYETMLGDPGVYGLRVYEASAEFADIVPKWRDDPGSNVYWYDGASPLLNAAQSTQYWRTAALQASGAGTVELTEQEANQLRKRPPRHLVILSETDADLRERMANVEDVVTPLRTEQQVVGPEGARIHVAVLTFEAPSCDRSWRARSPYLGLAPCP